MAGNEKHSDVWPHLHNALGKLTAPEFWHHDIAQEQVDLSLMRRADGQSFAPILSFEDDIPTALQDSARELPDLLLILHQQDNFTIAVRLFGRTLSGMLLLACQHRDGRKKDLEGRTPPQFRVERNRTAAQLHNPEDRRQSQPRPFGWLLCGKKWLKDVSL